METFEEQKKELGYWTLFWELINRDTVFKGELEELPEPYKKLALEHFEKNEIAII